MTIKAAYVADVREFEKGWGSRFERTLVSLDKAALQARIKDIAAGGSDKCYSRAGEIHLIELTDAQYHTLEASTDPVIWLKPAKRNAASV